MEDYKVSQLQKMLEAELSQPEDKKYGAHLQHWDKSVKPITIDEGAIKLLIEYYSK